jgi:hypothetical protein
MIALRGEAAVIAYVGGYVLRVLVRLAARASRGETSADYCVLGLDAQDDGFEVFGRIVAKDEDTEFPLLAW